MMSNIRLGALKMTDMKMTDRRNILAWSEVDGHENAGHVSGVLIGLHGIDLDLAVLPSNRLYTITHDTKVGLGGGDVGL